MRGNRGRINSVKKNGTGTPEFEKISETNPVTVEGLRSYRDTRERADELDEKIEKTDELIDEIVYELYGLTDEEIEIVEEAVE